MFVPTAVLFFLSDKFGFNTEKVRSSILLFPSSRLISLVERLGPILPRRLTRHLPIPDLPLRPAVRPGPLPLAQGTSVSRGGDEAVVGAAGECGECGEAEEYGG